MMEQLSAISPLLRVFVDGRGVSVPAGSSAGDAVRLYDPSLAAEVEAGTRRITDSRGLDLAADTPAHGGAIYRVLRVRTGAASADEGA
jgi:hypothetical protein